MLEMLVCSILTILPDYLFRRYVQGKRFGKEITLYSVWFELRWGITGCLILTVALITTVFYYHPSTTNVTLYFRTVPIVPEASGRVETVYVGVSAPIKEGEPIFASMTPSSRPRSRPRNERFLRSKLNWSWARPTS